jgi:hypothetical protein
MEKIVGVVILFVFAVCIYGIIDTIKQLKNMD